MGSHEITIDDEIHARAFKQALLTDLAALEQMLAQGLVEDVTPRIGAEQEMFLVDSKLRPAPVALDVLSRLKHPQFTTEIGKFNLEANLKPALFAGGCLNHLERSSILSSGWPEQRLGNAARISCWQEFCLRFISTISPWTI